MAGPAAYHVPQCPAHPSCQPEISFLQTSGSWDSKASSRQGDGSTEAITIFLEDIDPVSGLGPNAKSDSLAQGIQDVRLGFQTHCTVEKRSRLRLL